MTPPPTKAPEKKGLVALAIIALILAIICLVYYLLRRLYIDTHCAMILGTLVCK